MLRTERRENTREVFENLRRKSISFPNPLELCALLEKPNAQQPHELGALIQKHSYGAGVGRSLGDMLTDAGFFWATNDIAAVVDAAHRSGAVCLIAHPGRGGG